MTLLLLLALFAAACSGEGAAPATEATAGANGLSTAADADGASAAAEVAGAEVAEAGAAADEAGAAAEAVTDAPTDPTDAGLGVGAESTAAPTPAAPAAPASPVDATSGVDGVVAQLSLEQKVGQLFTVTVIGDDASSVSEAAARSNMTLYGVATPAEVVRRFHLGGVAYFAHDLGERTSNVADLARTAALSRGLQQAAAADSGIGLLIGADQEGGIVVRLRAPATVFPAAREIGDTGDVALARDVGVVTGTEARAVGVNWVYAPVADVNVNPDNPVIGTRAFGATTERVIPMALATAEGLAAAGVLPTFKHFPGHGDTTIDSHTSLPTIDHDRATLDAVDLAPFAAAAAREDVSVMIGHLAVPALDPSGRPATLSPAIVTGVLRQQLGFEGLVVTDAMNMGALSGFGDAGSLAVQAVAAGIDVVLMPADLPAAYTAVLTAAQNGRLPLPLIDGAVRRVLLAKHRLGVLDAAAVAVPGTAGLGAAEHVAVRDRVAAACGC